MTRPPADGPALTAAVIARDEAALLAGCLESLAWADARLVLVDARSRDATAAIAARYTPHVHREPFRSFPQFRNRALALATTPWVLFVDADERVPPALAAEIRAVLARAEAEGVAGYWLPRRNRVRGPTRHLREPLLHHNYDTLAEFVAKQRRYAVLEAYAWWRQGQPPQRARALVGQPLREFWRRYVTLGGYRDGALGLVLAAYLAYAAWQRTRLLRRLASAGAAR